MLQTLYNLGPAPEPNLTVLWSKNLPRNFKHFCAMVSIDTSSIQYENDDLMRAKFGDDYGIACCVSAMRMGKQMQFFGARANLAKTLLYAINGGRDEMLGIQAGPELPVMDSEILDYDEVMERFDTYMAWLSRTYVNALNIIHYMHDKYSYEAASMALHDRDVYRTLASLMSVSKLPYDDAEDGISYTMSIVPAALGKDNEAKIDNLIAILDGYFNACGHHVNVNVLNRDTLLKAMEHPEEYPQLTIRVSGYAVNFVKLTHERQMDVISRTFHEQMWPRVQQMHVAIEEHTRDVDAMHLLGRVHSFEPLGTVDGPGIRFVVFMQGCMYRCLYCHNRDTRDTEAGMLHSVADVLEEIFSYLSFIDSSHGGVTVTGGEPLLQREFVRVLFKLLRQRDIHTCLDTNGYVTDHQYDLELEKLLDCTSLILLDIKHIDEQKHLSLTRVSNRHTLKFAEYLHQKKQPVWIRHVVVPGYTDDLDDVRRLAEFIAPMDNVEKVELLPYHKLGAHKWAAYGDPYLLEKVEPPSRESMEAIKAVFRECGVEASG